MVPSVPLDDFVSVPMKATLPADDRIVQDDQRVVVNKDVDVFGFPVGHFVGDAGSSADKDNGLAEVAGH